MIAQSVEGTPEVPCETQPLPWSSSCCHLQGEAPDEDPPRLEDWERAPTDRLDLGEGETSGILSFDIDATDLASTGGCLEPRVVRFEIAEGPDELAVDVEWDVTLSVESTRKAPEDDDLSIEIEHIAE